MTTVNAYLRFRRLLPQTTRYTATIDSNNGDGTSTGTTRDGSKVRVIGESVGPGSKAWIEDGRIVGDAPNLTEYIQYL